MELEGLQPATEGIKESYVTLYRGRAKVGHARGAMSSQIYYKFDANVIPTDPG